MLLVDTGPLVATADADDADHATCRQLLEEHPGPLVTNSMVVAEAAYLIDRQLGPKAEAAFIRSIAEGSLRVESIQIGDWSRIAHLVDEYADLRLGSTDASLLAMAERLSAISLATLNRRDFAVVRPRHIAALELLPASRLVNRPNI